MAILITGGTGFLGRHVLSLLAQGYPGEELRLLSRTCPSDLAQRAPDAEAPLDPAHAPSEPDDGEAAPAPAPALPPSARWIEGTVEDADALAEAARGCRAIYHLAGRVQWGEGAQDLFPLHVGGTRNALAAARAAGVERVIYASTSGTVGISLDHDAVADEETSYAIEAARRWPYYLSKIFAERVAMDAAREGAKVIVLAPALLLGPGDGPSSIVARFLRREVPAVPSGVAAVVDVRDAAASFVAALERGEPGVRYLMGVNISFARLLEALGDASGVAAPTLSVPAYARSLADRAVRALEVAERAVGLTGEEAASWEMAERSWAIRSDRAARELGFHARPLDVTLADAVDDARARGLDRRPERPEGLVSALLGGLHRLGLR